MTIQPVEDLSWLQHQLAIGYVLFALALVTTLLRLWTRTRIQRHVGIDDWLILFAMIVGVGATAALHRFTNITDYINRVAPEDAREFSTAPLSLRGRINECFTIIFGWEMAYGVQLMSIKLSMLAFYVRCFAPHRARVLIYLIAATQIIATLVSSLLYIFVNSPIQANFDMWLPNKKANFPGERVHIAYSIYNLVTDVVILAIPVPVVVKLQMNSQKKIWILVAFLLGGITTVMTALRLYILVTRVGAHTSSYITALGSLDLAVFWSVVETCLGIICVNAPTLAALSKHIKERFKSSPGNPNSYQHDGWKKNNNQHHECVISSQDHIVITHEFDQTSSKNMI